MRITREEALRALELLEDYQRRLPAANEPKATQEERDLTTAIDRIIRVFKSNFFHALLDIQQIYAVSCADEQQHQSLTQPSSNYQRGGEEEEDQEPTETEVQELLGGRLTEILGAVLQHQQRQEEEQQQATIRPSKRNGSFLPTGQTITPATKTGTLENLEEQHPEPFYNRNFHQKQASFNGSVGQPTNGSGTNGSDLQHSVPASYTTNLTQEHFNLPQKQTFQHPWQQAEEDDDDGEEEEELLQEHEDEENSMSASKRYNYTSNNNNNIHHHATAASGYQVRPHSAISTSEVLGSFSLAGNKEGMSPGSGHNDNGTGGNWEYEEMTLERGDTGLGFSIAGGIDNPHVPDDNSIYITKLITAGSAAIDGRLQVDDIILQVNDTKLIDVKHVVAVEALKRAGNRVHLLVKRRRPTAQFKAVALPKIPTSISATITGGNELLRIELFKAQSKGLGFTIGGGVGNEHRPGDVGVYVTKVMDKGAAAIDGRLEVGDRLVAVNDVNLDEASHEDAVNALKATDDHVILTVVKPTSKAQLSSRNSLHSLQGSSNNVPPHYRSEDRFSRDLDDQLDGVAMPEAGEVLDRDPRSVRLTKAAQGLGFNIVGGEDGEGIFISFMLAGGAADLCGELYRGDQLLAVNGFDLRKATHEQAAAALKGAGQTVTLLVAYRPEEYRRFEAKIAEIREQAQQHQHHLGMGTLKTSQKKSLYVRALFDYDPNRDSGLPSRGLGFRFGNILHVTNASDDEWWQARRVGPDGKDDPIIGIVPSKRRVERRERARLKSVKFHGNNDYSDGTRGPPGAGSASTLDRKKKNFSFSRRFPFMKSREGSTEDIVDELHRGGAGYDSNDKIDRSSICGSNPALEDIREDPNGGGGYQHILSYEVTTQIEIDYMRPVVILGPLKERFNDDLISEYPDRFASCVPHTTRPRREGEEDGRDYYFVATREEMERDIKADQFIECGTFRDNLYGTSFRAVQEVARGQQKHCILDVSALAIPRLQQADLHPLAILIRPKTRELLQEWDKRMTDEEVTREYEKAITNESKYGQLFTAVLSADTPEEVYAKVKLVLYDNMGPVIWVPKHQKI